MAHALREFIRTQMDERQIDQATFTRTSGLTRSHVSKLLKDDREVLPQLPRRDTLAGIAKAFGVSPQVVLAVAVEALGLGYEAADFVNELATASNEELARELESRLLMAPHHGTGSLAKKTTIDTVTNVDIAVAYGAGKTESFLARHAIELRNRLVHSTTAANLTEADEIVLELIENSPGEIAEQLPVGVLKELQLMIAARRQAGRTPGQRARDALAGVGEESQDPGGPD